MLLFFVPLLSLAVVTDPVNANPLGQCTASLHPGHGTNSSKYKALAAPTASACCVLCQMDDRCGHFVYEVSGKRNKNTPCHLKEGKTMALNKCAKCTAGAPNKPSPAPAPTPPPIPPAPPVLGYKPHLIFFLGDDGAIQPITMNSKPLNQPINDTNRCPSNKKMI